MHEASGMEELERSRDVERCLNGERHVHSDNAIVDVITRRHLLEDLYIAAP